MRIQSSRRWRRPRLGDVVSLLDIDQAPESQRYDPWVASGTRCGDSGSNASVKVTKTTGRRTMKASVALRKQADAGDCWNAFRPGDWTTSINVRDFIVRNVTSYAGNEEFLAAPSQRTKDVWAKLQPYFAAERKKG